MVSRNTGRNIGIVAHIDAGKTTLTEQILYLTGLVRRPGAVEDGSTVADWMLQEQERGITIGSAAVTCHWRGAPITLVDTPGHVDFTIEVERALTVLDGAVVVFSGPDGVQAQTQTVWHQAARRALPVLGFVNKLDRPGFDDTALQADIRERLGIEPLPLQLPVCTDPDALVVLDVLSRQRLVWSAVGARGQARAPRREPITSDDELVEVEVAEERILDLVSRYDDAFAEAALAGESLPPGTWRRALAATVAQRGCLPLLYGVARAGAGVGEILDAVLALLPSAASSPPPLAYDPASGRVVTGWAPSTGRDPAAFVFKTEIRRGGRRVIYLRVFQGELRAGATALRLPSGEPWVIPELVTLIGGEEASVERLPAGTIGGALVPAGAPIPHTGETLVVGAPQVTFESVRVPTPVISIAVEAADLDTDVRMRRALDELTTDDPSLVVVVDPDTGRTLLAGMGELHLELAIERLTRDHGLSVRAGRLAPRHRAVLMADAAGRGSYLASTVPGAEVEVRVELRNAAAVDESVSYETEAPPRGDWRLALEAGVARAVYHDAQIVGASAVVADLVHRGAGLTPRAFWEAGRRAGEAAIARAGRQRAEPWMSLAIVVPGEHVGRVTADLARRRGRIHGSESRGVLQVLAAEAPLAELIRYATDLRSLTAGRGTFTMEPLGYRAL